MTDTVWVEVSKGALANNLRRFRETLNPETMLGAVVKANAYGHGLVETAGTFLEAGADWLCVNSVYEAEALRRAGVTARILVMGYVPLGCMARIRDAGVSLLVYQSESVLALSEVVGQGPPVKVHLKVETGNNRQGISPEQVLELARLIRKTPGVELEGLSSHYADIEDTTNHDFARSQLNIFREACRLLEEDGFSGLIRHFSNSAATMLWPSTHFEMVRVGISLYGMWPSKETYITALVHGVRPLELIPALSWKTRIAQLKDVEPGQSIGYGRAFRTTHRSRIAVLPVGYYDGYDRRMGNSAQVLVRNQICPVRGRICMNMTMVDVTDVPDVRLEDEVILLGRTPEAQVPAEAVAEWAGTINYEVTTRINMMTPRYYVE